MRHLLTSIGHTAVAKVLIMVVQLATVTILARKLSPGDYGIVGFATVSLAFLTRLNSMGLSTAVIQRASVNERVLDTAASLNLALSVASFCIAQLAAPLLGDLLNSPQSVGVFRVLAFSFLLSPLGFISTCYLTREMRFGALRTPSVIGSLCKGAVSIGLALAGWKYWSLVLGALASTLVTNGLLQRLRPSRFRWRVDRGEARSLLGFGAPVMLAGLITSVLLTADSFMIGSILGPAVLGYYTLAYSWATFACTTLQTTVHSVLFPKLSQLQGDLGRLKEAHLRTLRVMSFSAVFVNMAIFTLAEGFLVTVLGDGTERWLPAADTLRVLCVYGGIRAAIETVGNPVLALGRSRLLLTANGIAAGLEVALLPLVINRFGITGASIVVTVCYATQGLIYLPFLNRHLGTRYIDILAILGPLLAASISAVWVTRLLVLSSEYAWPSLCIRFLVYGVSFVAVHELFSRASIFNECRNVLVALRSRPGAIAVNQP